MIARYFLKGLLLPPAINIILLVVGLMLWRTFPRTARCMVIVGVASIWILSTPWVASVLVTPLETRYPILSQEYTCENAGAIVVLGGGSVKGAPEFGAGRNISTTTLSRLRYAASLAKRCKKPIFASGGHVFTNKGKTEAELMAMVLEEEFNVPVRWRESRSRTTEENAVYTANTLKQDNITSIVLVTSGFHMPRSMQSFQNRGLDVTPAPTVNVAGASRHGVLAWLPSARSLLASRYALHEYLGMLVYRFLY